MALHSAVLRAGDIDAELGAQWDALPAGRGGHADIFDSWAWHAALVHSHRETAEALRVVAAFDGDRPLALLPLTHRSGGVWRSAGARLRPRSRLVVGAPEPDTDAIAAVVDALAGAGGRTLELHRLPSRDPGTHALLDALRAAGYRVAARERSADRLAYAPDGWTGHAAAFRGFAGYARRHARHITALWNLDLRGYGDRPEAPVAAGFAVYAQLQERSWKGAFEPRVRALRAELLDRAESHGWARIYVLELDGVPVAGHVWFRIGEVATWLSTAYDRSLAVLSPGTVTQWQAHERVFHDARLPAPQVVDLLPGASPEKDRLSPERPPLLDVDAMRAPLWSGIAVPWRHELRRVRPAVVARARARARVWRRMLTQRAGRGGSAATTLAAALPTLRVDEVDGVVVDLDPQLRRYLAAAAGVPRVDDLISSWDEADSWWRVGRGPGALVRVGPGPYEPGRPTARFVREIVVLDPQVELGEIAAALGAPASAVSAALVRVPRLPWPQGWRDSALAAAREP